MITRNCLIAPLAAIIITFSSEIALAVENAGTSSSISMWPIIVAFVILFILRKQLITEATPQKQESDKAKTPEKKTTAPASATATKEKTKSTTKVKAGNIDLKDNSGQCQASTSTGTRCKRKTNLKDRSVTIDGTSYDLTVCSQHNNNAMKPFSELLK